VTYRTKGCNANLGNHKGERRWATVHRPQENGGGKKGRHKKRKVRGAGIENGANVGVNVLGGFSLPNQNQTGPHFHTERNSGEDQRKEQREQKGVFNEKLTIPRSQKGGGSLTADYTQTFKNGTYRGMDTEKEGKPDDAVNRPSARVQMAGGVIPYNDSHRPRAIRRRRDQDARTKRPCDSQIAVKRGGAEGGTRK